MANKNCQVNTWFAQPAVTEGCLQVDTRKAVLCLSCRLEHWANKATKRKAQTLETVSGGE